MELNYNISETTKGYIDALLLLDKATTKASDAILQQYGDKPAEEFVDLVHKVKEEIRKYLVQSIDIQTNDFVVGKNSSTEITI